MTFSDLPVVLPACLIVVFTLSSVKSSKVKNDKLPKTEKELRQKVKTEEERLREKITSLTSSMRADREESKQRREESKQRFDVLLTQIKKEWEELPPP